MGTNNFEEQIKPFFWVEHENSVSVCLNVGEYKDEIFKQEKTKALKKRVMTGLLWHEFF